ncbi:MAG: hypothetical protein QNJ72_18860 [Pleurocapsa sp. MO_226.B13]|nr:hypothetical protein [Pleurocapsa sp. MO_226.B13]
MQELTLASVNSEQFFLIEDGSNGNTLGEKDSSDESTLDNFSLETDLLNKVQKTDLGLISYRQNLVIQGQESSHSRSRI